MLSVCAVLSVLITCYAKRMCCVLYFLLCSVPCAVGIENMNVWSFRSPHLPPLHGPHAVHKVRGHRAHIFTMYRAIRLIGSQKLRAHSNSLLPHLSSSEDLILLKLTFCIRPFTVREQSVLSAQWHLTSEVCEMRRECSENRKKETLVAASHWSAWVTTCSRTQPITYACRSQQVLIHNQFHML